jgi:hypothetical protein
MAPSWIKDTPLRQQRTSDHSISIPRPNEAIEVGTPNACTTCHADRTPQWALVALARWGYASAQEVRPWVRTISMARGSSPAAAEGLREILADASLGEYVRDSALDLVAIQPESRAWLAVVEPFTRSRSPQTRLLALQAMCRHDPAACPMWQQAASMDSDALVRMGSFMFADPGRVRRRALRQHERDIAELLAPPEALRMILRAAALRTWRGERERAIELLDTAATYAWDEERAQSVREAQDRLEGP